MGVPTQKSTFNGKPLNALVFNAPKVTVPLVPTVYVERGIARGVVRGVGRGV